jgi:putative tricarboxylic transport membrane protein
MIGMVKGIVPYAALLAGALYLYHDAGAFASAARPGELGPDFWPKAILVLLMAVCAYEVVRRAVFARAPSNTSHASDSGDDAEAGERFPWLLAGGIVLTILYVLALDTLGFFIATALYLALFMLLGRYRRMRVIAAASAVGSLAFVFVFMRIVYVSLPLGTGSFKTLSVWILAMLGVR